MKLCMCPIPEVSATLHRCGKVRGWGAGKTAPSVDSYNVVTILFRSYPAIVVCMQRVACFAAAAASSSSGHCNIIFMQSSCCSCCNNNKASCHVLKNYSKLKSTVKCFSFIFGKSVAKFFLCKTISHIPQLGLKLSDASGTNSA